LHIKRLLIDSNCIICIQGLYKLLKFVEHTFIKNQTLLLLFKIQIMKKIILTTLVLCFLSFQHLQAQRCDITPSQIQQGSEIEVKYDPADGILAGKQIIAVAYTLEYGSETPIPHDVDLTKSGNIYAGKFKVPNSADGFLINFQEAEKGDLVDNNNDQGYYHMIYKDGKPVKNAYASSASAYGIYARMMGMKVNAEKSKKYFDLEIGDDQSKKLNHDYILTYARVLSLNKDTENMKALENHITKQVDDKKVTEKELIKLGSVASTIGNKTLRSTITKKAKTLFPKGKTATLESFQALRSIEKIEDAVAKFNQLKSSFGNNKDYKRSMDQMANVIASKYAKEKDYENVDKYLTMVSSKSDQAGTYNNMAWDLAGAGLEKEAPNINVAEKFSKKSLDLLKAAMEDPSSKPSYFTKSQWKRSLDYSYGMNSDTYALILYKNGKAKEAVKYQAIAAEAYNFGNAEMNERYALYLEKDQGAKATMEFLEKSIAEGHASSAMKTQLEKLFKANVSIDDAYAMYSAQLEKQAKAKKTLEIKEGLIKKQAPDFALTNLKGEEVSLESLKGKVVIVDFWATWCGPCKASFPGMQKVVNKFEDANDVEFVFIDTWESGKNKAESAQKFMDSKSYTFNVLMDNDNKMVADYGVSGIPTKFVLDKSGQIILN